jgi:hypothetical protein
MIFEEAKREFTQGVYSFCEKHNLDIDIHPPPEQKNNRPTAEFSDDEEHDEDPNDLIEHRDLETGELLDDEPILEIEPENERAKKLFKQIASKTHPDRLQSLSYSEKARKIEMFIKARKAAKEKNWYQLCEIALDLGIKLPKADKEQVEWLEKQSKKISRDIERVTKTYAWIYHEAPEGQHKEAVMAQYIKERFGIDVEGVNKNVVTPEQYSKMMKNN